ncbi:hypothetical protein TVNIR_1435 [Thioalkalivibrio nitratireducens DSM 14787]|uniref:Phosphoglycerate mutase n=1 Tax=Thioalkalivibrio nitratireducens (strain DSM 14787 / UNIQEM 213 / ALEN2) TaxID=1255043 RepID=L0DVU9_THIND|nr:hypothetical protein [Thioalkalivibrio nitratireducens]AGA33105.1 hypothetical protein TVNIR_1435 [Thioalkalivibrio nitratireducens DSM 14787]
MEILTPGLWGYARERRDPAAPTPRTLSLILGRGRPEHSDHRGWEEVLASRLGYRRGTGGRQRLLAFPVSLTPGMHDLVAAAVPDLTAEESRALWETAVPELERSGGRRREAFPGVSELEFDGSGDWDGPPPSAGFGRPMPAPRLANAMARRLQVLGNAVQMLWFDHPVNRERRASGRSPVQGLWFWSPGVRRAAPTIRRVAGGGLFAQWLATTAAVAWTADPLDERADLAVVDALMVTATTERVEALLHSLSEEILRPRIERLRSGAVTELRVHDPGVTLVRVARSDWRRFWRRPRPLGPPAV